MGFISWSFIPVVIVVLVFSAFRILREYERGVVFMLGRFWKVKGPGLIVIIPGIQSMVKVDLRIVVMDVPLQDVISRDNVSVKVNAVVYFRVMDPRRAHTPVRCVQGTRGPRETRPGRDKLNTDIQKILDAATDAWGIKVTSVEIKHIDIDPTMVRAIAQQAEAERTRRA